MTDDDNPYSAPRADPLPDRASTIRSLPMGQGVAWLQFGWAMFRRFPGVWILMVLVTIGLQMLIAVIPIVSIVLAIAGPVLLGAFMSVCAKQDRGEEIEVGDIFSAIPPHFGPLAIIGLIYLAASVLIVIVAVGFAFIAAVGESTQIIGVVLAVLVALGLSVPLVMAYWFAPALVVLEGTPPAEAMQRSFVACGRNILPFLLYGLIAFGLMIVAMIPLGLGFLVLGPVLLGSMYAGYLDIFDRP